PRRRGTATARTDQSSGKFACAQVSVDRLADPPDAGGKGLGGIDTVVSSQSGKCASRSQGASPQTISLPLLSLPTPGPKNCVLNMKTLFQRQWGWGEGGRRPNFGGGVGMRPHLKILNLAA